MAESQFYDSNKQMRPEAIGYFDSNVMGHYEWINGIIHDTPGVWTGGSGGALISGCIIWYAGKHLRDHVVYPPLDFSGNIVGGTSGNAIELGAKDIRIRSNIFWGGGTTVNDTTREILLISSVRDGVPKSDTGLSLDRPNTTAHVDSFWSPRPRRRGRGLG